MSSHRTTEPRRIRRAPIIEGLARRVCVAVAGLLVLTGAAAAAPAGARSAAYAGSSVKHLPATTAAPSLATGTSFGASISADGRYVAFVSLASDLVSGDDNGTADVFVRDRKRHVTRRVSVGWQGRQANAGSRVASISADGRFVSFVSDASNLVPGDTNHVADVFVRDLVRHVTRRVSVGPHGRQADADSYMTSISADGRHVAFASAATNLVSRDTNRTSDVFVRDRVRHLTRRVSVSSTGRQANKFSIGPSVSAHGRYVAFVSYASNLVVGDTNGTEDAFVRDTMRRVTRRVSVSTGGDQGNDPTFGASISADGRFVALSTDARLVAADHDSNNDVYLRDRRRKVTVRVTASAGVQPDFFDSYAPAVSADGRYVAFTSLAPDLVVADTNNRLDVFVWTRSTHVTRLVSISTDGTQGDAASKYPSISADGRFIAFQSDATNLVLGDANGSSDIFVRDRTGGVTVQVSR